MNLIFYQDQIKSDLKQACPREGVVQILFPKKESFRMVLRLLHLTAVRPAVGFASVRVPDRDP